MSMMRQDALALALDIGATQCRLAVVDTARHVVDRISFPTHADYGRQQCLDRLLNAVSHFTHMVSPGRILGMGISVASPVDSDVGMLNNPPNLPGWDGFGLRDFWQTALAIPVYVENDANAAALGEHRFGIGKETQNMIYLAWSTGIGGGIIVDGKLVKGMGGFGGEVGHMNVSPSGPRCNCGSVGCLEAVASGKALARQAQSRIRKGQHSFISDIVGGNLEKIGADTVVKAALHGDELATSLVSRAARALAFALVSLIHIFAPQIIVLGGGVAQSLDIFLPTLMPVLTRYTMSNLRHKVPLVPTVLGDNVGLVGAADLVFAGELDSLAHGS